MVDAFVDALDLRELGFKTRNSDSLGRSGFDPAALKKLFREFNLLCRKLSLFGRELIAIDGSFFKAVNSKNRSFTKGNFAKMIGRIDANIEKYFTRLDEIDTEESRSSQPLSGTPAQTIREKIATIQKHREELQAHLEDCQSSPTGQVNLTDPDNVYLIKNGQSTVGYNVQSAVDAQHHLIVSIEATQDAPTTSNSSQ